MKALTLTARIALAGLFLCISLWNLLLYFSAIRKDETRDIQDIRRQAAVNPWNPAPWSTLGRVYAINLSHSSMEEANQCFLRATRYSPWHYRNWVDCARTLAALGEEEKALRCMRMATELNHSYADFYWDAANFFVQHGRPEEAAACFRRALEGNQALVQAVLSICSRVYTDRQFLLDQIVPGTAPLMLAALQWCVDSDSPDMATVCFRRLMKIRSGVQLSDLNRYFALLLSKGRLQEAHAAWQEAIDTLLKIQLYEQNNLVCNGNFEHPLFNTGFGWLISSGPHVWIGVDAQTRYRDFHALGIFFDGAENATGPFLTQNVLVSQGGAYRFQFALKAAGLDSDQGPFFEVLFRDRDGNTSALLTCPPAHDDTDWKLESHTFTVPPEGGLVQLVLRRTASQKVDNTMKGRIWLDDIQLVQEKEEH